VIDLPFRLQGRPRLLAAEVAEFFAPLVALINGGLTARNFARRAGIRNQQKERPCAYAVVKARALRTAGVPTTVKLAALAPQGSDWSCIGIRFHLEYAGGIDAFPTPTPYEGTFNYGGSTGRDNAEAFDSTGWDGVTSLVSAEGGFEVDWGIEDPITGDVLAEVDLTAGNAPMVFVLTAIFRTRHQR
jgi:hypothetical protein